MRKGITMNNIFIIIGVFFCTFNLTAQTAQELLQKCIQDEQRNGAISIIWYATLCSSCMIDETYDGYIFIKKLNEVYKVRYFKYIHKPASSKVIMDTTLTDNKIQAIFKLEELYQDSISKQVTNIDSLMRIKIIKDGKIFFRGPLNHGKMRYIGLYYNNKYASSIYSNINLNDIFYKAYYYWLLNSSINNYIIDFKTW
jgi:hypothetical protein